MPTDSAGNQFVDFVWGNLPLQPDNDRTDGEPVEVVESDVPQNHQWSGYTVYPSGQLDPELDSHNIAADNYVGYPSFVSGGFVAVPQVPFPCTVQQYITLLEAAGLVFDDSFYEENTIGPELNGQVTTTSPAAGTLVEPGAYVEVNYYADYVDNNTVPDIGGLAWPQANAAIEAAGFTVGNTSEQTLDGATSENTNHVATQNPAAGSQAPAGDAINYVTYAPLSTATTGPISGFNRTALSSLGGSLNGDQAVMYVVGRETWPTVGSTITISGTSTSDWNQDVTVVAVAYDDSYNTGGTAIKFTFTGVHTGNTSSGGTWTKI